MVLLLVTSFPIIILNIYENINYTIYYTSIVTKYNSINCYRNKNRE